MTREARLAACAKLNLDLRVLQKRADGFHELRTVFQTISLADRLDIGFTPSRKTKINLESALAIPNNLVVRAAELVMDAAKVKGEVRFRLTKRIPMGAGLGGGSTDAAAVLLALPVLAGKILPLETLHALAAQLGSDVPFFLEGGTALGLGRGEELYPLPASQLGPILLVAPGVHVSTPEAYHALSRELTFKGLSHSINSFRSFVWSLGGGLSSGDQPALGQNDFESAVFGRHPNLRALKKKLLQAGALAALMTGSGSALFGIFGSREERYRAGAQFQNQAVFPVSAVSRVGYRSLWRRQLRAHITGKEWPPRSQYAR